MVVSQLPQIDIPSEETLNDEDNHIIQAFDVILNGYKRSQIRLHAISKAYVKLEAIARSLLKDCHENDKISPKKEEIKSRQELSSLWQSDGHNSLDDILTVDLTYDFESPEQSTAVAARVTSPIFGPQKKRSKKNSNSDEADLFKPFAHKNKTTEAGPSTKVEDNIWGNGAAKGDEENRAPLNKSSFKSPTFTAIDSTQLSNESQAVAQIGFSKIVYNYDSHKTPTGKRSRQAVLVFPPQTSVEKKSVNEISTKSTASLTETPKSNKRLNPGKNLAEGKENSFIITTPSQIDETARSLFDDEDLEEFEASKDLLNACLESPSIVENVVQPVALKGPENREKSAVPIASTSKSQSSQLSGAMDSVDETFFAPVEIEKAMKLVKKPASMSDCSTSAKPKDSTDKNRNSKIKPKDERQIEEAKELGDLEVQDIDWDQDMSTDNWPAAKQPLNNSFDFLPQKTKKSPNFAYRGKVERNHAERAKLPGWDCLDCKKYYGAMNLPEEELKKHMNRCSRHKSKYNPRYFTPKGFWDPVFPDATDSSDFSDDETFEKRKKRTSPKERKKI